MRADLGAFFKDTDFERFVLLLRKLLQPDGTGQPCRAGPDDDHIIRHNFPIRSKRFTHTYFLV